MEFSAIYIIVFLILGGIYNLSISIGLSDLSTHPDRITQTQVWE